MIHLHHILFEPVILKENFLSRMDTRLKVIWCGLCLILNLVLPIQIILLFLYLVIALSWKVRPHYILGRLTIPFLIGLFLVIIGLSDVRLALVIPAGVSCVGLLSFSTHMEDMLSALGRLRFPGVLVEIMFLMYKYIFIFLEEIETIYHAQKARMGYKDFKTSLRSLGILTGMLVIRSFDRAQYCYEAMLARGYGYNKDRKS